MIEVDIPGRRPCSIEHVVLDVNGTITLDGRVISGVHERVAALQLVARVHLLTADTRGLQDAIDAELGVASVRVKSDKQSAQKASYVQSLGSERVCAIGNGAIDSQMLGEAGLGIAVLGEEGLAVEALTSADVVVPDVCAALDLLLDPLRLKATLRR